MAEELLNAPTESDLPVDNTAPSPTPVVDGKENLKLLHGALSGDSEYSDIIPKDFNKFLEQYKDPKDASLLFGALTGDTEYSDLIPKDPIEAGAMFGISINKSSLGKPSAVPSASEDGGSATKGSGVELRSTLPQDYTAEQAKFDIESKIPGAASMNLNYGEISKKMQGKTPAQAVQEHIKTIKDPVEKLNATRSLYKNISSEAAVRATQSRSQLEEMDQSLPLMEESLAQMKAQAEELQSTNPDEANRIVDVHNKQLNEFNSLVAQRNGLAKSYEGDAKLIATMNAGRAAEYRIAQSKGDIGRDAQIQLAAVPMNAMFGTTMQYSPADAMAASAWNAMAPNMVRALAGVASMSSLAPNLILNAFGEESESNPMSDALLNVADAIEIDVDKYVPKEGKGSVMEDINPYTMGKMTGSLLGSVAGSMAGGTARAAQVFNAAQGFGSMYDWGRKHGMNDRDAMLLAAPVGIVYGYLGDKGVEALAGAFGKESTKKLLLEEIKALGANPSKSALAKVAERFVVGALKAAPKEALQESVEFSSEFGLKKGAIEAGIAMPRFGEDYSSSAYYKGLAESATVGAAGGGVLGGLFSVASRKTYADIVANAVQNPNAENEFISDIDELVLSGNLTPEQGDAAIANLEKAKAAAAKIPSSVSNPEAISNATELLQEKEDLVAEMEGKDPAMTKPMSERLATIGEELGAIATQEIAPQAEAAPVVEVSQPEIVPQAQPTTEAAAPQAPVAEEVESTAKALDIAIENNPEEFIEDANGTRITGGINEVSLAAMSADKKPSITSPTNIPFLPKVISLIHLARNANDKKKILAKGFDSKQTSIDSPIPGVYFSSEDWSTMGRFGRKPEDSLWVSIENNGLLYFDDYNSFRTYLKENGFPFEGRTLNAEQLNRLKEKGIKGIVLRKDFASQSRNELIVIDNSIIKDVSSSKKEVTKLPSSFSDTKTISEAYHKAKADGSNPELVTAVEELLAPKSPQAEAKPAEEVAPQAPVAEAAKAEAPVAEAAPSKAKASVFADIDAAMEARGTAATEARAAAKETHGKENTDKAIRITREFDKIVKKLEKDGMLTKKCP